jgi:peptidyl-prolyl cis-trans isomerase B (cyclophilin B)
MTDQTSEPSEQAKGNPRVTISTSLGEMMLELDRAKAPVTTENFVAYAEAGHYDGTVFHRVIPGFMIQGGGFDAQMRQKPTQASIANEAHNGLRNERGTIAMARTSDPHSATSQFFINLKNNSFLDHVGKTAQGWGYTVFGRVVEGTNVLDAIAQVPTGTRGPHCDVPNEPVLIESVTVTE